MSSASDLVHVALIMAAMEEIETLLQSLKALKPPGITKTKIDAITLKCVDNIQVCGHAVVHPEPLNIH